MSVEDYQCNKELSPNETFSLVQSTRLSGKLSRLKNKQARRNVHASRLNANGSKTVHAKKNDMIITENVNSVVSPFEWASFVSIHEQ